MELMNKIGILLCTIVCVAFIEQGIQYNNDCETNPEQYVQDKYGEVFEAEASDSTFWKSSIALDQIKKLYPDRMGDYKEDQDKISGLLQYMMVFLVIGLLMLFYRPEGIRIPMVNLVIPKTLVHIFVVGGTIFMWANFSLLLMSTVDSRMVLETMTDRLELASGETINHYYSNSRVLLDQGFIDPWCTYYHNIFKDGIHIESHKLNAGFFLFGIYASFLGSVIGSSLTLANRLVKEEGTIFSYILTGILFFSLASISIGMVQWFGYAGFFYAWVWGIAAFFLLTWGIFGKKIADRLERDRKAKEEACE
jgi:hypothetical protein